MRLVLALILFVVALVDLSLQYSAFDGLKACQIDTGGYSRVGDPPVTYHFNKFNDGEWRVKELRLYYGDNMLGRFFWGGINQTPGSVDRAPGDGQALTTFEFVYADGTVECFTATVPWYNQGDDHVRKSCPQDVSRAICPTHPLYVRPMGCATSAGCTSDSNSVYQWQCNNGVCLHQFQDTRCQDLYATTTVQLQTRPNSLILTGFRLSDCSRNPVLTDARSLVIVENDLVLMPVETKANMIQMRNSINFVQLMVGMCPRTLIVLEQVIEGLHSFVNTSNMEITYIALSAFDGAKDFVSLLPFTQNTTAIHEAIDNLRNYDQRDASCNIKQSTLAMLHALKARTLGQPWDRKFLVIFSASIDITNFVSDFDVGVEFSSDREVFTFFIGMNIPQTQWPVLSAIGNAGYFTLARETAINRHYVYVANVVKSSHLNEYLLGYCSPSRTNKINAKLLLTLPSNTQAYIQQFPFDAAGFGGKCSTTDIISELCDCATYDANSIKHGTVLCYQCYKSSFTVSGSNTQALLRYPIGDDLVLRLNFTTQGEVAPFDVYLRKGGVSSAWLYDTVLNAVTLTQLPLDGFVEGDLVGVYFDFKGKQYDAPPVNPVTPATIPVTPPVTVVAPVVAPIDPFNTPVTPPRVPVAPPVVITYPVAAPVADPIVPPLTVVAPVAPADPFNPPVTYPAAAPVTDVNPIAAPVADPIVPPVTVVPPVAPADPFNPPVTYPAAAPVTDVNPIAAPVVEPVVTPVTVPSAIPIMTPVQSATPVNSVTPLAEVPTSPPTTVPPVVKIPVALAPSTNSTDEEATSGAGAVAASLAVISALVLAALM